MRTWYVPLEMLDDNRVVAQHREVHTVMGSITSVKRGYINHPVTKLYLGEHLPCLIDYHTYTVREMERRGWTGHGTPVKPEVLYLGLKNTPSCGTWQEHVSKVVPSDGQYSLHGDLHDLIERWTREGKQLRNNLAQTQVSEHQSYCPDKLCRHNAADLLSNYRIRSIAQIITQNDPPIRVIGNASLRGKIEYLGAA